MARLKLHSIVRVNMSKVERSKTMLDPGSGFKRGRHQRPGTSHTTADGDPKSNLISETNELQRTNVGKISNTFRTTPDKQLCSEGIEQITETILTSKLKDVKYDPSTCKVLSQELAGYIMEKLKSLNYKRFKLVAVVSLGSIRDRPRLQFGSRCFWNPNTDRFASVKYTNGSLFAVAMIYGLYFE